MLLPRGAVVYENLNTSFTQFDALLADLKSNQFTGAVRVMAWEYEGVLLLDMGNIVGAQEQVNGVTRIGASAVEAIANKAREKDGAIHVSRLAPEIVALVGGVAQSEPLYKDLASDFTSLEKLIAKLQGERHTGYIEIRFAQNPDLATIWMQAGAPVECVFTSGGDVLSGAGLLEQIIQAATQQSAFFTVYRADLARAYGASADLGESFTRQAMLGLWQEVFQNLERALEASKPDLFRLTFKRVCIEHADAFPFLDPFAGELEYRDETLTFNGQVSVADFNRGLAQTLAATLGKLAASGNAPKLQAAGRELYRRLGARLDEVGIIAAAPEFFGG